MAGLDTGQNCFNFELSVFNLVKMAKNYKLVLKTKQASVMFSKGKEWPKDNEAEMVKII